MLVIGSRGSQLALWQSQWVAGRLRELGHDSRIEIIKTTGDKITDVALAKVGTKGLFTKEIEEALLDGRIDCAVHSLKDLPTDLPEGLQIAATPEREDPRDAMAGARLQDLPRGAKVGTSSLRRAAQLRQIRSDLSIENIRGNLDTRLKKLDEGQYDAIVLAAAGLKRLGLTHRITEIFDPGIMCPAPGQGALAIEVAQWAPSGHLPVSLLDHPETRAATTAERALLASLGGGCQVPIGAHAQIKAGRLHLLAVVASPDGARLIRKNATGDIADASKIGARLGATLLGSGAREILEQVYAAPARDAAV